MKYKNKIESMINTIKIYNLVTDLYVEYNMDRKFFTIKDKIENRFIQELPISLSEFQNFIKELNNLSLWDSDYEMDFRVIKN